MPRNIPNLKNWFNLRKQGRIWKGSRVPWKPLSSAEGTWNPLGPKRKRKNAWFCPFLAPLPQSKKTFWISEIYVKLALGLNSPEGFTYNQGVLKWDLEPSGIFLSIRPCEGVCYWRTDRQIDRQMFLAMEWLTDWQNKGTKLASMWYIIKTKCRLAFVERELQFIF